MFVYGDVVYAQTWQVLTLKNCMEPFSYASAAYVVASALVSVRLFCKNLGNLKKFFGQMVYRPPLAKNNPCAYDGGPCWGRLFWRKIVPYTWNNEQHRQTRRKEEFLNSRKTLQRDHLKTIVTIDIL